MIESAYDGLLTAAAVVLGVLALAALVRLILGPRVADRIVMVNMITTLVTAMLAVLAVVIGENYIADIGIVYALLGFSAGGPCAASVGTLWNTPDVWQGSGLAPQDIRPDALVLCYPVITAGAEAHRESFVNLTGTEDTDAQAQYSLECRVSADTPPTFLWHTWADESVPVANSLLFASALARFRVPAEVHLFPRGRHGSSLCREETSGFQTWLNLPECAEWPGYARRFLEGLWAE